MPIPVVMPQLGESIVEATLVKWRVALNDRVERGDPIADVETDKASSELPAPASGRLVRRFVEEGQTVDVGTPLAEIEAEGDAATAPSDPERTTSLRAPDAEPRTDAPSTFTRTTDRSPVHTTSGPTHATSGPSRANDDDAPTTDLRARAPRLTETPANRGGPPRTSPAVRRLARRHGIDLNGLVGSGRHGRVTRDDLLAMIESDTAPSAPSPAPRDEPAYRTRAHEAQIHPTRAPATSLPTPEAAPTSTIGAAHSAPPPVARAEVTPFETALPAPVEAPRTYRPTRYAPQPADQVVPFNRRRKWIAEHMVHSLGVAAHVASVTEIDLSRVARAREAAKADAAARGLELTYMPYIVSAVADALAAHPELNATVVDESLVLRADRNIGIAVDTEDGLAVFVVKRADELGLFGIARAMNTMAARARAGALEPEDTSGGSFTVSNPGKDGNLFGVSIIRQPEVGILRVGAIVKRPVVRNIDGEDAIVIRPMMYACLSYDHRVIDGRTGNAFLSRVAHTLSTWGARD